MEIHQLIKKYRKMKGLSQFEMAIELELSQSGYSDLENGKTNITIYKVKRIAAILNIPAVEIIPPIHNDNQQLKVQISGKA